MPERSSAFLCACGESRDRGIAWTNPCGPLISVPAASFFSARNGSSQGPQLRSRSVWWTVRLAGNGAYEDRSSYCAGGTRCAPRLALTGSGF